VALLRGVKQGQPFLLALLEQRLSLETQLERELERWGGPALVDPRPDPGLLGQLPAGLCARLLAFPVGSDGESGFVDIAAAEPQDPLVATEFAYHLQRDVRLHRASLARLRIHLDVLGLPPGPDTVRQDAEHMNQAPVSTAGGAESLPPIPLVRQPPVSSERRTPGDAMQQGEGVEFDPKRTARTIVGGFAPVTTAASVIGGRAPPPTSLPQSVEAHTPQVSSVARSADLLHPGAFRISMDSGSKSEVERALGDLAVAETPDEVVRALAAGMAGCCEEAIVFAVRGRQLVSHMRLNYAGQPEEFDQLKVARKGAGTIHAALDEGQVVAPPTPEDLLLLVGQPAQVCATVVEVMQRPALLLLVGGFLNSLDTSHTAERLARAAADALTRILRTRKQ
jgi:hypothetical protein